MAHYIDRIMTLKNGKEVYHIKTLRRLKGDPYGCYEVAEETSPGVFYRYFINQPEVVKQRRVRVELPPEGDI
jgi:hypothetical protein